MKLQGFERPRLGFLLFICMIFKIKNFSTFAQTHGTAAVAKDVINMVKDVQSTILETWAIAENSSLDTRNNDLKLILSRFKDISKEISLTEEKYVEPMKNFINLRLVAKRKDITNTMNAITVRFRELQDYVLYQDNLESSALLTFVEGTSTNFFSVNHLMDRLHLAMFGSDDNTNKTGSNIFEMLLLNYGKEERCLNQQSAQQFIYSLFTEITLREIKSYTLLEFSWVVLKAYGKGNPTQECEFMRNNYKRRTDKTLRLLSQIIQRADRIVWRCDPDIYVEGKTFEEVTRLLQGYIENEVDMSSSRDCMQSCAAYGRTKNEGCYMDQFCAVQERCSGQIHDCYYAGGYFTACPSALESLRRYEYIQFDGRTAGRRTSCSRGESPAQSWMRYLLWECSYCYCICDDQNSIKTDRYFNLRETLSNVNDNKVVTGLRFIKANRIFHLQIQEGQLLPRGIINESSIVWKPVDNYTLYEIGVNNNQDYFTLTYDARSIDLDDIQSDDSNYVVTGVRFRVLDSHLNLQVRLSKFNFETGQLLNPKENSYWKFNVVSEHRRSKLVLIEPDIPTLTAHKSEPDSNHNQYMQFSTSSLDKDAAQTTVPFIDIQDVVSKPPVPLAGIGIYHKGKPGFGGFLAPKLMTYDFSPHIHTSNQN